MYVVLQLYRVDKYYQGGSIFCFLQWNIWKFSQKLEWAEESSETLNTICGDDGGIYLPCISFWSLRHAGTLGFLCGITISPGKAFWVS